MIHWAVVGVAVLSLQEDSSAQPVARRPRLGITIAGMHLAQRVPAISPNRYTGPGLGFGISYSREGIASHSEVALAITYARLTSANDSLLPPSDEIGIVSLALTHLRRADGLSSPHLSTLLGLRLAAVGNFDVHHYGSRFAGTKDGFDYVALTLAPTARLIFPIGGGHLAQELSIPIAGLADFPYVNGNAQRRLHLRAVTIPELLALDERLTCRVAFRHGWGIVLSYHLSILRHARYDTRRYARQGLSATLSVPVGKRRS
jgi:hypothetical protein